MAATIFLVLWSEYQSIFLMAVAIKTIQKLDTNFWGFPMVPVFECLV
jgi:hypothetical protein